MSTSTMFRVLVFVSVLLLGLAVLFAPPLEQQQHEAMRTIPASFQH